MINDRPNIFEFATSELSQDAVLLYLADCYNYEATKKIGEKFLQIFDCNIDNLDKVYPLKQFNKIDVLIVLDYIDHYGLLVIEDKTESSFHDNQLERYKEFLDSRDEFSDEQHEITPKKVKEEDIHFVYFKPLIYNENEEAECKRSKYAVKKHDDFFKIFETDCDDPVWKSYKEYYKVSHEKELKLKSAEKLEDFEGVSIDDIMSSYCGQWRLMSILMSGNPMLPYKSGRQYQGSSYGRPWTQYRFVIDNDSKQEHWMNLNLEGEKRGKYSYFFRLDWNTQGYYISCNQYIYDEKLSKSESKGTEVRKLMDELEGKGIAHVKKGKGKKETSLWLYNFHSIAELNSIKPDLIKIQDGIINSENRQG